MSKGLLKINNAIISVSNKSGLEDFVLRLKSWDIQIIASGGTARKLRENVYEKGSTEEAMDLYVKFRGRKPIIEPLLKVRGLNTE